MVSNQGYPSINLGAKESLLALTTSSELVHTYIQTYSCKFKIIHHHPSRQKEPK